MLIHFTKMHGIGNDFIVIDNMKGNIALSQKDIIFLCDRHLGIGADGIILIEKKEGVDCFMNYINADGTFAEMCGNGIRCTAKFFKDKIASEKAILYIGTRSGIKEVVYHNDDTYSVTMGMPLFIHEDFPNEPVHLDNFSFECVSVGNPHAVTFVDNVECINILSIGPIVENNSHFPNKINVHFVEKISDEKLKMRVWERGSGLTLACGTGAVAVYAIAHRKGIISEKTIIHLPAGELFMSHNEKGEIIMRGPASNSFDGDVNI